MFAANVGERGAERVGVRGCREGVVIPLLGDKPSLYVAPVEVCHHGGPRDAELLGEFLDGRAGAVRVGERVDVVGV